MIPFSGANIIGMRLYFQLEEADWLALYGMIVYNGGRCQGNLSNKCTHLITSAMEGVSIQHNLLVENKWIFV